MDQVKIGEFLKTLRKEKGLTQEQLAEQFNVSRRTVSRWETSYFKAFPATLSTIYFSLVVLLIQITVLVVTKEKK